MTLSCAQRRLLSSRAGCLLDFAVPPSQRRPPRRKQSKQEKRSQQECRPLHETQKKRWRAKTEPFHLGFVGIVGEQLQRAPTHSRLFDSNHPMTTCLSDKSLPFTSPIPSFTLKPRVEKDDRTKSAPVSAETLGRGLRIRSSFDEEDGASSLSRRGRAKSVDASGSVVDIPEWAVRASGEARLEVRRLWCACVVS